MSKKSENPKSVTFHQNPEIDILFGSMNVSVPSKRVDFKPIDARYTDEDGNEQILKDFYVRKPNSQSVRNFENLIRSMLENSPIMGKRIPKPGVVEVMISLTLLKSEFDKVDVDNVAKTVLDSIKGYLFDDDSQVVRLVCEKSLHDLNVRSFLIAVTEIKPGRPGLFSGHWLYSLKDPSKG